MSEIGNAVEISDSHLYKVTMVVAIPNYLIGLNNQHQATAIDFILEGLTDDAVTVLDVQETKLGLVVTE
jgi:hypothetical protein